MERGLRQTWAFMFRGYHLTRRYLSWVVVFNFYALTGSAAVALIGVAANDHQLTLTLIVGALLWNFLSVLYNEIAMSIAYERWEGTLEYTFMAPVSRLVHLVGVSLFALCNSVVNTTVVLGGLMLFTPLSLSGANLPGILVVILASTLAFVGLGVMAAALPVLSPERGAEGTHIFQGSLLLVSGVYYPVDVLPAWIQPLSALSPATYTLSACRKLVGIGNPATTAERLRPGRALGQAHGTLEANGLTPRGGGAAQRAGRSREPMTKAARGAATKPPKSQVPASAAASTDAPPPRPAALAMTPDSAAPSAIAKS